MNDLEKNVLQVIGESTSNPDVFEDTDDGMAQIRDSINDAIEEISMLTGSVSGTYYLPLRTGRNYYRLAFNRDRFGWITSAWTYIQKRRLEQTDLIRLNAFNPRWMLISGSPESYFQVGHQFLGVYPAPAGDGEVLRLDCIVIPDRYTSDEDRLKVRDIFKWGATFYAISEYYASRGDATQAATYWAKYLERVGLQSLYPQAAERGRWYRTDKEPWPRVTG